MIIFSLIFFDIETFKNLINTNQTCSGIKYILKLIYHAS
jgi:hypothetical protein